MKKENENEMSDKAFHSFLKAQGAEWRSTVQLNPQLQQKCLAAMNAGRAQGARLRSWGSRTLVSTMGLAAAVAIIVTLGFPLGGNTPVAAKTVLAKLAQQVQGDGVLSLTFNNVEVDEVAIQGHVQIANDSIAGDVQVTVKEDDGPIVVDAALAVTPKEGWVLVRRLEIPEPEVQAIIGLILGAGSPAMILLPDGILEDFEALTGDKAPLAEVRRLAMGEVAQVVREILKSDNELGAVTTRQPDGTTRVTVHVKDVEVLRKLVEMGAAAAGKTLEENIEISEDDANEILGCTLSVDYDPQTQSVRSFSITDVAEMKGTITIGLYEGAIDPRMLDSARVATPNTRTIDAGFLKGLIESAVKEKE